MNHLSVGAINKSLPDWVWSLSKTQCITLLESMVLGDGCYNIKNPNRIIYYTNSDKLADDVMRLALHCGWCCNKILHHPAGNSGPWSGWGAHRGVIIGGGWLGVTQRITTTETGWRKSIWSIAG